MLAILSFPRSAWEHTSGRSASRQPLHCIHPAIAPAALACHTDTMLTPAEELGLSGLALASRVRNAFHKIPDAQLIELERRLREEAISRHLIYLRDGQLDPVPVFACPMTALPDQISYIHFVTQTIQNALKRLPDLYLEEASVRDILRLKPAAQAWLT